MMKILIIKLGAIGDVIRTTSILPGLKSRYEECSIEWVTKSESFDILKNSEFIDSIFLINSDLNKTIKSSKNSSNFLGSSKISKIFGKQEIPDFQVHKKSQSDFFVNKNYDLIINFDDELEACKLASSMKAKKIVGAYLKNNKRVYTKDAALWFDMGLISKFGKAKADELKVENKKTYQEIMYKILDLDYKKQEPILKLSKEELKFGKEFARKNNIKNEDLVIGINTGAGGRWQDKKLSIKETSLLIDRLNNEIKINNKNTKLLLFGGPEEKDRNEKIKTSIKTKIIDAGCDNSLMEFSSLINLCNILVTSDSLALHIGVALKKRIVCFFAPTSPTEIKLYSRGIKILPKKGCICCYKPKCDIPPEWDIEEFVEAVKKLI